MKLLQWQLTLNVSLKGQTQTTAAILNGNVTCEIPLNPFFPQFLYILIRWDGESFLRLIDICLVGFKAL